MAKKKAKAKAHTPKAAPVKSRPTVAEAVIDKIVGVAVALRSREAAIAACLDSKELKLSQEQAEYAVDEARRRIVLAAQFDYATEIGVAKTRLEKCYAAAAQIQDVRSALAATREINKLLDLYPRVPAGGNDEQRSEESADMMAAREVLSPLVDGLPDEPLEEIARRVVTLLVNREGSDGDR